MFSVKQLRRTGSWLLVLILIFSAVGPVGFADVQPKVYPAPSAVRQLSGEYSVSTAYSPEQEKYLSVYQDYNDLALASSIKGQWLDVDGNKTGVSFTIAPISRNMPENPYVTYNEDDDNFLVVWNDGISTARRIYGVLLDAENNKLTEIIQFDPELGPYESHDTPRAAYSPNIEGYAIVWNVRNEFEVVIDGVLVNNMLEESKVIEFDPDKNQVDELDIHYNEDGKNFIIVGQYGSPGSEVLRSIVVQVTGGTSTSSNLVPSLTKLGSPKSAYNFKEEEEFVIMRHINDSKHYLLGRYRKSSDPVIEFSSNLLDDTNTLAVGVNSEDGSMLVAWSESVGSKGYIYVQELYAKGTKASDEPNVLVEVEGYLTDINVVYNDEAEKFIVTYAKHKKLANPELTVRTFPLDESLDMTNVTETQSSDNVKALSTGVKETLTSTEEKFSKDAVKKVFEVIETNIGNIKEEEVLVPAIEEYINTLDALGTAAKDATNESFVEEKLVDMAGVITQSIQNVKDKKNITAITESFIGNVNKVHEAGLDQTVELNVSVGDFAQGVIDKVGEVKPEITTQKIAEKTQVLFDPVSLQAQVTESKAAFETVKGAFEGYYGEQNVREFELKVTLTTERVDDDVQVPLNKTLISQLQAAEVDQIGVKVGGTQLVIDESIVQESVTDESEILVDIGFNDAAFTEQQKDLTFKSGYTSEVEILVGGEEKKVLEEPVQIAFDLEQFEFFDEQYNPSLISVFRLNEETGEWEPVGGVYDPVTNTVTTSRIHLSQYTVMQSNKQFNDVETSWAKAEINELLGKGIIDETVNFNPEEAITREEFTTWVTRAYGLTNPEAEAPFEDLGEGHEHEVEIASAYAKGIISGSSPTTFNPDGNMTKEQMTVILANAMVAYDNKKLNEGLTENLAGYRDSNELATWADDQMALMVELGIVQISERGILPQDTVTKEMAASIIKKIKG